MRAGKALVGLLLVTAMPAGAEEIELDLADGGATMIVVPGTEVTFKVTHRLPAGSYRYEADRIGFLAPLALEVRLETDPEAEPPLTDACRTRLDEVRRAGEGSSERALRAALLDAAARSPDADCTRRIRLYESGTEVTLSNKVTIGEGQIVVVKITRLEPEGADPWRFEIGTGEDRRWAIHYGFSFLPDEDEEFSTRPVTTADEGGGEDGTSDGGGFAITRSRDRSGAEFEPTVTFTYLPRTLGRSPWIPRFTAGLGADLEEQLVFAGLSWVVGDNVSLFVGAAGHEQTRLKGIYDEGQIVEGSLTSDQLVDETFELNVIFGVGFRFDKNPFKKADPPPPGGGGGGGGGKEGGRPDQPPPEERGSAGGDDTGRGNPESGDSAAGEAADPDPESGGQGQGAGRDR